VAPGLENRVILISDAGLNTGVTDENILLKEVADYAGEHVGLTAIGVGDNFNQKFVRKITESQGGNYLFVQSGKRMIEYFQQFDFFVSPVAYNLKAQLNVEGLEAKLAKAYGVPTVPGEPLRDVIDIRSLFLAASGGGALLLEYDLK
jgi:Ca-activated chloride channel family protein